MTTIIPNYYVYTHPSEMRHEDFLLKCAVRREMDALAFSLQSLRTRIVSLIEKNPTPGQKVALQENLSFCEKALRVLQKIYALKLTYWNGYADRIEIFQGHQPLGKAAACIMRLKKPFATCESNIAQIQANFKSVRRKLVFL